MPLLPVSIGEIFEGKYRIEKVIGEGGMGVVVMAHHLELDQPVAIKFLLDGLNETADGAERFRREARAAAKIQSDHVARVYDVGILATGERYMVMEYLKGRDLGEELSHRGRLPVAYGARLMLEVLEAMSEAHGAGIVHRDLKPSNVYLAERPDGRIRVKVLDFGISKAVGLTSQHDLSLTKTSAWMGSPLYMAPEQMQSARTVDARADIWSFGAIFYEVLTGEPPYVAESLPQLCTLLLSQDARPVREKRAEVPRELDELVLKCLRRDPNVRYPNTVELTQDLHFCLAQLSASGRESSPGPASLSPIASRLMPTDSRGPDFAAHGTLVGHTGSTGPVMPSIGSLSAVNPGADTALHPTNGSWSSATQKSKDETGGAAPKPAASSGNARTVTAVLALLVVGGLGWIAFGRPTPTTEPMSPTSASTTPPPVDAPAAKDPDPQIILPASPPAVAEGPSADENSADENSADLPKQDDRAPGARRAIGRPVAKEVAGPVPGVQEPRPEVSTPPPPPPETKPARSEPASKDEFGRFGGRR